MTGRQIRYQAEESSSKGKYKLVRISFGQITRNKLTDAGCTALESISWKDVSQKFDYLSLSS